MESAKNTSSVQDEPIKPPYLPYTTFRNFIEKLSGSTIPQRIDKSVVPTMSSNLQSHLFSTLKFFGAIDNSGHTLQPLHLLVQNFGKPSWASVVAGHIVSAYKPVIGDLDVVKCSFGQVEEAFTHFGTKGSLTEKAVRFYLKALEDAKIPYSPHFPKPRKSGGGRRKRNNDAADGNNSAPTKEVPVHATSTLKNQDGMRDYHLYFNGKPNGIIRVPESLTKDDCNVIKLMLAVIEASVQTNK